MNGSSFKEGEVIEVEDLDSSRIKGKGKKRIPSSEVSESFDLTLNSSDVSPPKRSRRAADAMDLTNLESISVSTEESNDVDKSELNNNDLAVKKVAEEVAAVPELEESFGTMTRRGRPKKAATGGAKKAKAPKAPKVPKAKKLSLTSALKITLAAIPQLPSFSTASQPSTSSDVPITRTVARSPRLLPVDLTGDVHMTDVHSTAPLFQKQPPKAKPMSQEPVNEDDDEAYKLNVKVKNTIRKFQYRLNQKFVDLYKIIAEQEAVPISTIFIYNGDKRIDINESPHSVGCKYSTILTCRMMELKGVALKQDKKNQVELKFQSNKWKRPLTVKMSRLDNFKTAVGILCEQIQFKPEQITLRFDGDRVEMTETPIDLDFEGGEILDCLIKE